LLIATPFNNKPSDIFSLLKLFIVPKKSTITLEKNLEQKFSNFKIIFNDLSYIKKYHNSPDKQKREKAKQLYQKYFSEENIDLKKVNNKVKYHSRQIRNIIEPVIIRRNRLDLKNNPYYKNEVKELSEVDNPREWFYQLTEEQMKFYESVLKKYFVPPSEGGRFTGAIYKPFYYEKGISDENIETFDPNREENFELLMQFNLYDLMRRLLVKRFESSFGVFYQSLKNFEEITKTVYKFIEKTGKYILDRKLIENISDYDIDEIEQCLKEYSDNPKENRYPQYHKVYEITKFKEKAKFIEDIKNDILMFEKLINKVEELKLVSNDPKVKCLIANLQQQLNKEPSRKIIIFSESIDTVKYLQENLEKHFKEKVLTIPGVLTGSSIDKISKNFDASYPHQSNDYDILITKDKLSEGVNLNRAGMVINYDIPWNPVRVIQRLSRINRISKKIFEKLYIVNFFPSELGADYVKSREIAASKMFLIHNALGEDARIFDVDEEPSPSRLYERINQNPDQLEEESFYTKIFNEFEKISNKSPDVIEKIKRLPNKVKVAKPYSKDELIVFLRKSNFFIFRANYNIDKNDLETAMFEDVFESIKANENTPSLQLSNNFWKYYEKIKDYKFFENSKYAENSLQQKALNVLKSLKNNHQLLSNVHIEFIETIIEDINNYGKLTEYKLREIINLDKLRNSTEKLIIEFNKLNKELGGKYYLEKIKLNVKDTKKEIIIEVENQKKI